jgi:hypothetical protein
MELSVGILQEGNATIVLLCGLRLLQRVYFIVVLWYCPKMGLSNSHLALSLICRMNQSFKWVMDFCPSKRDAPDNFRRQACKVLDGQKSWKHWYLFHSSIIWPEPDRLVGCQFPGVGFYVLITLSLSWFYILESPLCESTSCTNILESPCVLDFIWRALFFQNSICTLICRNQIRLGIFLIAPRRNLHLVQQAI